MRTQNISIHFGSDHPRLTMSSVPSAVYLDIGSYHPQDYSITSLFFNNLDGLIAFKNEFIGEFNKLMKELGYDR